MKRKMDTVEFTLLLMLFPAAVGYPWAVAAGMLWATSGPLTFPNVAACGAVVHLARVGVASVDDPEKPYNLVGGVVARYVILGIAALAVRGSM